MPRYAPVYELHQATQVPYDTGITPQPVPQEAGSSSQSLEQPEIAEQFLQMSIQQGSTSQVIQPAPPSCKSMKFPLRPGLGSYGTECVVKANHFFVELPDNVLHRYDTCESLEPNYQPAVALVVVQKRHQTRFHAGIQISSSSRLAHCHMVWDENKFTADELQSLTNNLCYIYARCT
ncbi:hypothetical protein MLD38_032871 [Melastoma candidum]|uniref:Uncharacterized protein n=1 Tax=Melastoma candidum TaxID=119954 RepID=A0ACB9M8M5_9MYRT|nr:hypothetical protein MLD38_032871 [Melastoma candidum]